MLGSVAAAHGSSVRPRLQSDACVRPLSFTVRATQEAP